jgi:hypothetical protein
MCQHFNAPCFCTLFKKSQSAQGAFFLSKSLYSGATHFVQFRAAKSAALKLSACTYEAEKTYR